MAGDEQESGVAARGVDRGRDRGAIGGTTEPEGLEVDGMNGKRGAHLFHRQQSVEMRLLPSYHRSVNDARAT